MTAICVGFAGLPILMLTTVSTQPMGLTRAELLLYAFLTFWMAIPLLAGILVWRSYVSSRRLDSGGGSLIICSVRFVLIDWKRSYRDTDRAWLLRRRIYQKRGGYTIADAIVIRSMGRKRFLADGILLTSDQIHEAKVWLESIAEVPVKDLRHRVIG